MDRIGACLWLQRPEDFGPVLPHTVEVREGGLLNRCPRAVRVTGLVADTDPFHTSLHCAPGARCERRIEPQESLVISVRVDAPGTGTFERRHVVATSEGSFELWTRAEAVAEILRCAPPELDFGVVPAGSAQERRLACENLTELPLRLAPAHTGSAAFRAPAVSVVAPLGRVEIPVWMDAAEARRHTGTIRFADLLRTATPFIHVAGTVE